VKNETQNHSSLMSTIEHLGVELNLYFVREGESYADLLNLLLIKPLYKKLLSYSQRLW
jgi:hypothetical protein